MTDASATFAASLESCHEVSAWLEPILRARGFGEERRQEIELAVVEAFTNVVRHGLRETTGATVGLEARSSDQGLAVTLVDPGPVFDPTRHVPADRAGNEPHGMGIMIIRATAQELRYERVEDRNRLELRFI